jgi:hypothetical protein
MIQDYKTEQEEQDKYVDATGNEMKFTPSYSFLV